MPAASSCWTDKMRQCLSWNATYCLVWSLVDWGWHPFYGKVESHRFTFKPSFGLVKETWDYGGNIHNDMKSMQTLHERNHIMTWNLAGDSGTIMLLNKCWIFNLFHLFSTTAHEKNYLNIDVTEDRRSAGYSRTRTSFPCFICSQMAPCEFFSEREAEGQWDIVPVGLFYSVRTECRSQAGLLGNRVSSRLQLA